LLKFYKRNAVLGVFLNEKKDYPPVCGVVFEYSARELILFAIAPCLIINAYFPHVDMVYF
jgi:hypothetical protein